MFILYKDECILDTPYMNDIFNNIVGFYTTEEKAENVRLSKYNSYGYKIQKIEFE